MLYINLISGSKTKFFDPEIVISFDYDKNILMNLKSVGEGKYNKRTKTWHYPKEKLDTLLKTFPNAIVNQNIKKIYANTVFSEIDFPKEITVGWGAEAYKINTTYNLPDNNKEIKINAKPYPYQKEGIKFLVRGKKVILADDMGLGKTLQAISAAILLKKKSILIVSPNSAKYNWADEIQKFAPNASYIVIDGTKIERERMLLSKVKFQFYIVNYDALPTIIDSVIKLNPNILILDEAHRIKNSKTKRAKAVKKINAEYKFLLTGTPLMNRVEEMWSLLKTIEPNKWAGHDAFVKHYCQKGGFQNREIVGYQNLDELKAKLHPIMLRRRKDEVLKDLPEKLYKDYYIDLDAKTMAIYKQAEKEARAYITENKSIAINGIFAKLTRLKQIAVAPEILGAEHQSIKIKTALEIIDEILSSNEKVIIYSQFRSVTELLEKELLKKDIKNIHINGTVSAQTRQELVRQFQNDEKTKVFIGTTQSCKEALTLTAANYIIFLDKLWNPQDNRQAEDRAFRIGQKKNVTVISIIAKNTIEEKIEKTLKDKQDLFNDIIEKDGGATINRETTNNLLETLFKI